MDFIIPSVEMRFTSEEEKIDNLAINILKLYSTQVSPRYGAYVCIIRTCSLMKPKIDGMWHAAGFQEITFR